jgi:hypothetical protein
MRRLVCGIVIIFSLIFWILFRVIATYEQTEEAADLSGVFFIIFILSVTVTIVVEVLCRSQKRESMD